MAEATTAACFWESERRRCRLSQREVAQRVGVSNTTVSNWETGMYAPDLRLVGKLARLFGRPELAIEKQILKWYRTRRTNP